MKRASGRSRPSSVRSVSCSSKSTCSVIPAISMQRRSCSSPHWPRVCGWRSAFFSPAVSEFRLPTVWPICSSRVRVCRSTSPRLRTSASIFSWPSAIRSASTFISAWRLSISLCRLSQRRLGVGDVDLARLLVGLQQVGHHLRGDLGGRFLDRRAEVGLGRGLLLAAHEDVEEGGDEGQDGDGEDDGHRTDDGCARGGRQRTLRRIAAARTSGVAVQALCATMDGVSERLLTALGALAAAAAVVGAFALLFTCSTRAAATARPPATVVRVQVPAGTTASGEEAKPGHAAVGAKAPQRGAAAAEGRRPRGHLRPEARRARDACSPARAAAPPSRSPTSRRRPVDLETAPGGPVVAKLGDQTEFGSPASFSVVATKPGWLGVTAPEMPDGELGWIARDPAKVGVYWTRYSLHADLAGRSLELRYGHKVVEPLPGHGRRPGDRNAARPLRRHRRGQLRRKPLLRLLRPGPQRPPGPRNCRPAGSAATASRSTAPPAASAAPKASAASAPPTRRCATSSPASPSAPRSSSPRAERGRAAPKLDTGRGRLVRRPGQAVAVAETAGSAESVTGARPWERRRLRPAKHRRPRSAVLL